MAVEAGETTMGRPPLALLFGALTLGTAIAASQTHDWVPVPHQKGIRVDLQSIEHGHFLTGGYSSPVADTRAVVDTYGTIWPQFFWCTGPKTTFGPMQYGKCCAPGDNGRALKPTHIFDMNKVQAFVCLAKPR